jgi:cardiolipin synthase
MLLVPPAVLALVYGAYKAAFALVVIAGVTDAVDGFLARRFDWISRLGSILDPLADKLLLVSSYVALAWLGHLPVWLATLVLARDGVIVTGATVYHFFIGPFSLRPTWLSKANTGLQAGLVVVVLAGLAGVDFLAPLVAPLVWAVTATTLVTGGHYVWVWSSRALAARGEAAGR